MAVTVTNLSVTEPPADELADIDVESAAATVNDRIQVVDRLFKKYRKRLLAYVTGLMSSTDDAEEVVQDTYVRLLQVPRLEQPEARARGYAFRIATNLAYDRFRARRARGKRVDLEESNLADRDLDPGQIVYIEQRIEIIKQIILEIKPRSRQVYLLRSSEQLTYPEIAKRLGVSTRTVEREMRYVIDLCQQRLQTEPGK